MRPGSAILLFCVALSILSSVENAQAEPVAKFDLKRISEVRAGIFCYRSPDYVTQDSATIDGKVDRFDVAPDLVKQTQVIPAIDGLLFGVSGRGTSSSGLVVTMEIVHPPLGKAGVTREAWDAWYPNDRTTMNGYTLGLDRGSPLGVWTLTAKRNGKKVYEVVFEVVEPSATDKNLLKECQDLKSS